MAGRLGEWCFWHDMRVKREIQVISHACVVPANQSVYAHLAGLGFEVSILVPATWHHHYSAKPLSPEAINGLEGRVAGAQVRRAGRPQRYGFRWFSREVATVRRSRPDWCLIEEESFSVAGAQWSWWARRHKIPYAIQMAENLDRPMPLPVKWWRRHVLAQASLVMARSVAAAELAVIWGARAETVHVVPHGIDGVRDRDLPRPSGRVGYVGRLVSEKGIADLVEAISLDSALSLDVVGDGPLRPMIQSAGTRVRWLGAKDATEMPDFYESIAVLALPSRTTPTWSEQFGRVIIEALAVGTPVVAYDSGEIPWVAGLTGATTVHEGDVVALARELRRLSTGTTGTEDASRGRSVVAERFTNAAVAQQLSSLLTTN